VVCDDPTRRGADDANDDEERTGELPETLAGDELDGCPQDIPCAGQREACGRDLTKHIGHVCFEISHPRFQLFDPLCVRTACARLGLSGLAGQGE
jgi:hypothetical protein